MEQRSRELTETLKQRREGLHVEQAADLLDNLQLAANRDFEVEQLTRETEELLLVQRALDTMKAGHYGVCVDCEEAISPKRLQVMPWAVRCISCQQLLEDSKGNSQNEGNGWEFQAA